MITGKYWKNAVIYQVYPRSFRDSNGDGIGDLRGIVEKIPYLVSLGVDVIWINPVFQSPNDDNGYDISDYREIMPEFGNMADFEFLLESLHAEGIKLVLDMVVNHSSDEHEWFKKSRSSREDPYRNYYHWWPAEKGIPPARFSHFDVESNAWKYDALTDAFYLHYFSQKQPDLNWENPVLREEIYDMMRFWLNKGVDGFRLDVITFISKDVSFPLLPQNYNGDFVKYYAHGPNLHFYLKEMHEKVFSRYDMFTIGENVGISSEEAIDFVDPDRKELDMMYHFEGVNMGYVPDKFKTPDPAGFSLVEFKKMYSRWNETLQEKGWGTIYLGNHDQPRMVSRWANDSEEWRMLSSKMLTTFLLSMRGTPIYYQGDEIGMANIRFKNITDYRDIETINMYRKIENEKGDLQEFLEAQKFTARDNSRTPFQWDDSEGAGFTTGTPWIKINPDYNAVNVKNQESDPGSCLNYFRKMIRLRKENPALIFGKYQLIDDDNPYVYIYIREYKDETFLVALNFTKEARTYKIPYTITNSEILISNYLNPSKAEMLKPYEAAIFKINGAPIDNR